MARTKALTVKKLVPCLLHSCDFYFYTTRVEVYIHHFSASCAEVIFNFCPSWSEVVV